MSAAKIVSSVNLMNGRIALCNLTPFRLVGAPRREYRPPTYADTILWRTYRKGNRPNRHWNPKFSYMRSQKVLKVDLSHVPEYYTQREHERASTAGPDEIRAYMKKQGIPATRPYRDRGRDRPIHVSSTSGIIEQYIPPEGDGRASRLTREGVGQLWDKVYSKGKDVLRHVRTVRRYDEDFDPKTFGELVALPVFVEAHNALMERDVDRMHELVTEHAFSIMHEENRLRSLRWELVESIEPARVVHVRASGVLHEDNVFAQVTVRMHSKQKLAIYDQFGRLYLGSNEIARDVLEYAVFERHLVDPYGSWRLHAKIVPDWLPPKEGTMRTFRKREKAKRHNVGEDVQTEEFIPLPEHSDEKTAVSRKE